LKFSHFYLIEICTLALKINNFEGADTLEKKKQIGDYHCLAMPTQCQHSSALSNP
jgi:hypothetical protein